MGVDFEGRCFGFGSPKLDLAGKLSSKIPDAWKYFIEDKPVTLICNSLGPFLTDPVRRMEAYRTCTANELKEGHAVIFRPHPLLKQTIRSMVPEMESYYTGLLIWMEMQRNVLVDDSEYLERALGVACKLISDGSSVVSMWLPTHLPYEIIGETI